MTAATTWLVDWSDLEDAAYRPAMAPTSVVRRARPLQLHPGELSYRVRSRPRFVRMALEAAVTGPGPVLVWQPAAAVLAGSLPRRTSRLVGLNPLLRTERHGMRERLGRRGLAGLDVVVSYSSAAMNDLVRHGAPAAATHNVPMGIGARSPARRDGGYLLAAGASQRDWATLSRAAALVDVEVRVLGPSGLAMLPNTTVVSGNGKTTFETLLDGALAVIVPLVDTTMQAGTLAVLNALARGVPVVATRNPGTVDYVRPSWGRLVAAGDVAALGAAMDEVAAGGAPSEQMAVQARAAVLEHFSVERFVRQVEALALG